MNFCEYQFKNVNGKRSLLRKQKNKGASSWILDWRIV